MSDYDKFISSPDFPSLNSEEEYICYRAGFDCAIKGANANNCHYNFFQEPKYTAAWQRGKSDGDTEKASAKEIADESMAHNSTN